VMVPTTPEGHCGARSSPLGSSTGACPSSTSARRARILPAVNCSRRDCTAFAMASASRGNRPTPGGTVRGSVSQTRIRSSASSLARGPRAALGAAASAISSQIASLAEEFICRRVIRRVLLEPRGSARGAIRRRTLRDLAVTLRDLGRLDCDRRTTARRSACVPGSNRSCAAVKMPSGENRSEATAIWERCPLVREFVRALTSPCRRFVGA
jgi:hypothetical protein